MKSKLGRPPAAPLRSGTMHLTGEWVNRLWVYKEAVKHGLSQSQIFDMAVEAARTKYKRYNPQKLVDELSWDDDPEDVADYDKKRAARSEIVSRVEKKINDLDARRTK